MKKYVIGGLISGAIFISNELVYGVIQDFIAGFIFGVLIIFALSISHTQNEDKKSKELLKGHKEKGKELEMISSPVGQEIKA